MKKISILLSLVFLNLIITFGQYNMQKYTMSDGLSHKVVLSISEDNKGNMWFGTYLGLNKFDGSQWTTFKTKDGLPSNKILCLFSDDDKLWIGTTKGVAVYDGTNWSTYNISNGLPHNIVYNIVKDNNNKIQIATRNGVAIFDGANFQVLNETNGLTKSCTHSIAISDNGIWYGAYDGNLTFYNGENWNIFKQGTGYMNPIPAVIILDIMVFTDLFYMLSNPLSGGLIFGPLSYVIFTGIGFGIGYAIPNKNNSTNLLVDSENNLWFGAYGGGLFKFDGNNWTSYGPSNGIKKHKRVMDIIQDNEGNIWVSKVGGISKFDGNNWTEYNKKNGVSHNFITDSFLDSKGNIWFGTRNGITKFSKQ